MNLPRRQFLSLGTLALAAPALTRRAGAEECTGTLSLHRGIAFRRKDGSRGLARQESDGAVVIDYITNQGERTDRRRVVQGVFETWRLYAESEFPVVGSAPPEWTWKFSPKPVMPEAGGGWKGKVAELRDEVGYGTNMKESHKRSRTSWTAEYRFLAREEVKISGCYFLILPVEASFTGDLGTRSQRWLYFEQHGFGLETRRDGVGNGLTALTPV